MAAVYNYQAAWYDVIDQHSIYVDADLPTVDLSQTPATLEPAETVLYIGANDASSPLTKVEYRVNGEPWQTATPNGGAAASSAAWLFYFQRTAGAYTIEAPRHRYSRQCLCDWLRHGNRR